jgi:hypothetical protein
MDNASSHKTKLIRRWFAKRSHWHVHFTPTSSSWINQVERFFALLSEQQIKRGAHRSVAELEDAITAYIKSRNAAPKPFRWTKSPMTSWHPSSASVAAHSTLKPNLHRNFRIGTLVWAVMPSQKLRKRSSRLSGALPAMIAALIAPIEMPATKSGIYSDDANPSYTPA